MFFTKYARTILYLMFTGIIIASLYFFAKIFSGKTGAAALSMLLTSAGIFIVGSFILCGFGMLVEMAVNIGEMRKMMAKYLGCEEKTEETSYGWGTERGQDVTNAYWICEKCGNRNENVQGAIFCKECGNRRREQT